VFQPTNVENSFNGNFRMDKGPFKKFAKMLRSQVRAWYRKQADSQIQP